MTCYCRTLEHRKDQMFKLKELPLMGTFQIKNLIILNFNLRQHISEMLGHVYHSKHTTSGNRGDELVDFLGEKCCPILAL